MTGRFRVRWLAVSMALLPATAAAEPAQEVVGVDASPSVVRVEATGCWRLRSDRIEQLLRLELTTLVPVVRELPMLDADFVCSGDLVRITLRDPVNVKMVTRDISLGASPDAERTLALAASELFLASRAELLLPAPEDKAKAPNPAATAAKEAVERVIPPRQTPPLLAVDLRAIGRARHLSAPLFTVGAGLRLGQARCDRLGMFVDAGWEVGSAARPSGQVDVGAATLGVGARWCRQFADAQVGVSGSAGAVYVSLQGVASSPSFFGAHHDGFTAEASGGIDASVTVQTVRLGAAILAGALAPGPSGRVDGGAAVRFDGPWAGATLFAGLWL